MLFYLEDLIESSLLPGVWYPEEIESAHYDASVRLTRRGIIPQGDSDRNFNTWLAGVSYPGEIDSAQYDTRGDWLCAEWYPEEIESALYDTPGRFRKIQINFNLTKIEIILTHWSVAQAGSNDEKNGGRKSL